MLWLAQTCLIAQIILAPLMLGGLRPWALAILTILTGIGILAICLRPGPVLVGQHLRYLWLAIAALIGWCVLQSLSVWPVQAYPFNAPHIALAPYGWLSVTTYLIWLGGVVTLTALVARLQPHLPRVIARTVVFACVLQVVLAVSAALMGWQTTFWFAKQAHLGDWTGSFANRNAFGTLMGFGIVACLFLFQKTRAVSFTKQLDRAGGWLALATILTVALVQSHSRLAFIMALVGGALFVIATAHKQTSRLKQLLGIGLGCIAITAVTTVASPELFARFTDLGRSDLIQRDDLWAAALQAILERPITGWGADSVALVIAHFAPPDLNAHANWFSSHNLWLDGAIMFGLPVMLILVGTLLVTAKTAITNVRQTDARALLTAFILMGLIGGIGDWVMIMPGLILPMVMLGMASFEGALAGDRAAPASADHAVQSPLPDREVLH